MPAIVPVILSGGSGTRLWPVSSPGAPKQLQSLFGNRTLLQATADRVSYLGERLMVIANRQHLSAIRDQLSLDRPTLFVGEPVARNTGPAVAAAALLSPFDEILVVLPADHYFRSVLDFREAVDRAVTAAADGYLVTFGIVPTRLETGFGHIVPAEPTSTGFRIERFVEKPDAGTAASLNKSGALWNSGMFVFAAGLMVTELERQRPGLLEAVRGALPSAPLSVGELELGPSFAEADNVAIDVAVMEPTDKGVVVPLDAGWSDVGSWASLWELGDPDEHGNVTSGHIIDLRSKGSYLRSDGPLIAAIDLEDLVVVATPEAVLVAKRGSTQDVRKIVEMLEAADGSRKAEAKPD
jgi:mannose-1-phosphate guanylyltransferase/mannose-6-phosphate isomerase